VGGWLVVVTDEVTSNIIIFCEDGEQALDYLPLLTSSYLFFSRNNGAAISQMPDF
jgi:hypothetical protein